jgi:hypothetical protein
MVSSSHLAFILFAAYQVTCEATGGGLRKPSSTRSLKQTDFYALVDLLNNNYDSSCAESGGKNLVVNCKISGGQASLTGERDTLRSEPTPTALKVCSYGDNMKQTCQQIKFTGDLKMDMKKAETLLSQGKVMTDYDMLVELLEERYDDQCEVESTEDTTTVVCTMPGGEAHLTATGTVNPIPQKLESWGYGAFMVKCCYEATELTGQKLHDIPAARKQLNM